MPKTQTGLGFKDLSIFNNALWPKQTWRPLHDTQSLFYVVFKAKFFSNYSVMEAKTLNNASYAWKSILKGREVIKKGAAWKKIWSLNVPAKVKHRTWHACQNSLPTKTNLVKHNVFTDGQIYKLHQEDMIPFTAAKNQRLFGMQFHYGTMILSNKVIAS